MKLWQIFSIYVHPLEKRFDRLLRRKKINFKADLVEMMQQDLVILLLWVERRFKGYKNLKKPQREFLHQQSDLLKSKFKTFQKSDLKKEFKNKLLALDPHFNKAKETRLYYLFQIMQFLTPGQIYTYKESTSFDRLLSVPGLESLIGDCNQIVGLYIYLYSLKYPITDLSLTLLPKHVALHFENIDIEATTATFHRYQNRKIVPVTELIAISILDIPDKAQKQMNLSRSTLLESAKIAKHLSSSQELVTRNLKHAYHNLALEELTKNNFSESLKLARLAEHDDLRSHILIQAIRYYGDKKSYKQARSYLLDLRSPSRSKLKLWLSNKEISELISSNKLDSALSKAKEIGDKELQKHVYAKKYNKLQDQASRYKTRKEQKQHISVYKKMYKLAVELNDQKLKDQLKHIINELQR